MSSERKAVRVPAELDLPGVLDAPVATAVHGNGFVFTMGYMAMDPATGDISPGTIEHETRLTLQGLARILEAAGTSLARVVKVHVFLADIDGDFDGMNGIYAEFFDAPYPARRTVQARLARGLKVEIDVVALE